MDTPDLNWSWPPATGDIRDADGRVLLERSGLMLGLLDTDLPAYANQLVAVRADGLGLQFRAGITQFTRTAIQLDANTTLGEDQAAVAVDSQGRLVTRLCYVQASNATSPVILTVPATAPPGLAWNILQTPGQTGTVTIRPASGVTLGGQTSDLTLDGPGALVSIGCFRNSGGSAAECFVKGESSLAQTLSGLTTLGAVRGAYPQLGADVTDNLTLTADDRGTERRITATSQKTITVPSAFTGTVKLRNVSSVAHLVALPGVGNRTIPAGAAGIVDCNGQDYWLHTSTPASS
jgi:hypothetical protein